MGRLVHILLLLFGIAILVVLFCPRKESYHGKEGFPSIPLKEGFKVLGTLANQDQFYYSCLAGCEWGDPIDQLGRTVGNPVCLDTCDYVGTALADNTRVPGISDYLPLGKMRILTVEDQAYALCGDGTDTERCKSDYVTAANVKNACSHECKFANLPYDRCMEHCNASKRGHYINGWIKKWAS